MSATTAAATLAPLVGEALDDVLAIERTAFARPWPRASFLEELARDDRRYLVAIADGRVRAYGGIADQAGEVHVMRLATAPDARGRGLARLVLGGVLTAAVDAFGARRATLEVRESNLAARSLYGRAGFTEAGVRPGYYAADGEGAVVLWCDDLPAATAALAAAGPAPVPAPVAPPTGRRR